MKTFLFLILLLCSGPIFAQLTGTSVKGRLFKTKKKPIVQKEVEKAEMTSPIINIVNPIIPESKAISYTENIIVIRGEVIDNTPLKSVNINGEEAKIFQNTNFFANVPLENGINNILVEAENTSGVKSEIEFIVNRSVDLKGPVVEILEPTVSRGIKIVRKTDVVVVRGLATDESGVKEVFVNNRLVNLKPDNEFRTSLFLGVGNNEIIVKAIDNLLNSSIDTFFVERKIDEAVARGRYVALCIGINSYDGYWNPLKNAVNDAKGVSDVLKKDYLFDDVYTLLDKDATRTKIIQKLEELSTSINKDDNLLIFYAGHGQYNKRLNKGYWVPVDSRSNSVAGYISNNDIKTFLGGIPSKHTFLITDACFAGDIFRGPKTESIPFDPNDMSKYYKEVHRKPSRLALTSGSLEEVSDAGKDDHSVFTYYLIKALRENSGKYMDASQLFDEFKMAVVNNSEQTPQLNVVRDTDDEGGQFVFIRK